MALISALCVLATIGPAQTGSVDVPFKTTDHAIIVEATVNNANVSLMFDTGFSGSVALNNNIDIGKPTGTMNLQDFVGVFQVPTVKVKSLKLGGKQIDPTGMEAVLQPMGRMSFSYNAHADGIMGFEVIHRNITQINFEHSKFVFLPKTYDINKLVPDNKKTFMCKLLPIGHQSMEMEVKTKNGGTLTLALDTGNSFYATTHKDVLERLGLWKVDQKPKYMKQSGVASGSVDSWSARLKDMTIFGAPVPDSVWDIIDRPSSSAEGDGTVGFGFLKNFNITIDYEKRRIFLENFTGKMADEFVGEVGIGATYVKERQGVLIYDIVPEGPADRAGIKEGDMLLTIDGQDLDKEDTLRIDRMLEGKVGSKVKIVISQRGGAVKRLELERALLVNEVNN